jgi:hypothetical protein
VAEDDAPPRSYGCSYGCGRPYDFIVTNVSDMSSLALCAVDFMRTAHDMMVAAMESDNPDVQERLAEAVLTDVVPFEDNGLKRGRHNAPVEANSADAIAAFDGFVFEDELPDEIAS